jgi:hypothetical protein
MLEIRDKCERCEKPLAADTTDALICSFECTFCSQCGADMNHVCPNCSGELVRRPARVTPTSR